MAETLEEPEFELISSYQGFEVRKYTDTIQARVLTEDIGGKSTTSSFRRIAGYIFGANERQQVIAMTAPVHMWKEAEGSMMAFTMPSEHSIEDLPKPSDEGVDIVPNQGQFMAVSKFSWGSGPRKSEHLKQKLSKIILKAGLLATGPAILAVYDNPYSTLPFLRRNEILIPIEKPQQKPD